MDRSPVGLDLGVVAALGAQSEIVHGDCVEVLRGLREGCIPSIVTDPPYAFSFMGKGWDKVLPPVEVWSECLRVAKPGAMLLAFGGTRTYHRLTCAIEDAGWEIRDCLMWLYGSGFPKSKNLGDGYGTALKPAWEPIILAMKPLDGTFANNALKHGVAGLNVDGCRIGRTIGDPQSGWSQTGSKESENGSMSGKNYAREPKPDAAGRWPANVILDEEAASMLDEQAPRTGQSAKLNGTGRDRPGHGRLGKMGPPRECEPHDALAGASRFFYCAKSSRKERGEGNTHPTVKPVELMRWLVRLCAPPTGGIVLDPFAGSGTTGVACALEGLDFLGIEREAEYVEIARRRCLI